MLDVSSFARLAEFIREEGIPVLQFERFEYLQEKGVTELIAASIPTSVEGFIDYLKQADRHLNFEGVWTDDRQLYTLGVVRLERDPKYRYYAFILESEYSQWKPGEIKAKFSNLVVGEVPL